MLNILLPMAGLGSRFTDAGYKLSKPLIPVTDINSGKKVPMVLAAINSFNELDFNQLILIDRTEHEAAGIHDVVSSHYPQSQFITLQAVTEGQASTCLVAKDLINTDDELLIGACDSAIVIDKTAFDSLRKVADCIIFTHKDDINIEDNPTSHSWAKMSGEGDFVEALKIKETVSENPKDDNATTGFFWFKHGKDFVTFAQDMIAAEDKFNNEYYVDKVINYLIANDKKVAVFDVRLLCWGTPKDYELYENTIQYWKNYLESPL